MAKRIIQDIDPTSQLEVSFVRRGANPMAKVFLKKSADQPQTETTNMALKSVVLAGLMGSPAGVALAKSFTDEAALDAFVAKSDAEQAADLEAFAKAHNIAVEKMPKKPQGDDNDTDDMAMKKADLEKKAVEDAIAKAIEASPLVAALKKQNDELSARLEKSVEATVETSLRKRAETEFKHLGLGFDKTVGVLKALGSVEAGVREDIETVFKAHAKLCALMAPSLGLTSLNKDASSATAQLTALAKSYAETHKVSEAVAFAKVCDDPAHAALVEKADEEQSAALAA